MLVAGIEWLKPNYCSLCSNALSELTTVRERDEMLARRIRIFRKECPPIFWSTDTNRLSKICRDAISNAEISFPSRINTILIGPTGYGKSRTAWKIIEDAAVKRGCSFIGRNEASIVDKLNSCASFDGLMLLREYLTTLKTATYLLIDDLGKTRYTPRIREVIFAIINHRYERHKTTIYTTQFTGDELCHRMTSHIPDSTERQMALEDAKAIIRRIRENAFVYEITEKPSEVA